MAQRSLLAASIAVLLWPLALYPAVLWLIARARGRRAAPEGGDQPLPTMTVVLPTYRERANINARLENLATCRYPGERLEVVVVDSASGDGTAEAAEAFAARNPELRTRVLRETKRGGKAAAVNFAISQSMGDLVLVTDAPTRFDPEALALVAERFHDPSIGAATGRFQVFEQGTATQREESLFWTIRNLLRNLEADVDSTPFLSGELCCFRRALVQVIDTDTIADDMNVALQVRRQGYRAIVDSRVLFTEPRPPDVGELMVRKVSRAAGGIQELLRHRDLILRPGYGLFGMLILPSDLAYYLPLRIPALAIAGAALLPALKHRWPMALAPATVLAIPSVRRRLADTAYVLFLNEWLFIRGWHTVLCGKTEVLWAQEARDIVPNANWAGGPPAGQGVPWIQRHLKRPADGEQPPKQESNCL
jgi:cellulose synthase/poly-beta-1,6-N-acetylglucosamine synthase-like glycosyltransferase